MIPTPAKRQRDLEREVKAAHKAKRLRMEKHAPAMVRVLGSISRMNHAPECSYNEKKWPKTCDCHVGMAEALLAAIEGE